MTNFRNSMLPFITCAFICHAQSNIYKIHSTGIGPIHLGMSLNAAKRALPGWVFKNAIDDEDVPCIEGRFKNKLGFQIYLFEPLGQEAEICSIVIWNPEFKTVDGIGPGCSFSKIQRIWGAFQFASKSDARAVEYVSFLNQPKELWLGIRGSVIPNPNQKTSKVFHPNAIIGHIVIN